MTDTTRDIQLDIYRALTMVYIVCVIHVVYWFGVFDEPVRSILLFEMPVIFFISGASYGVKHRIREVRSIVKNRVKRVLLPFYIFLSVLFLLLSIGYCDTDIRDLSPYDIVKILMTGGSEKIPYYSYTWFISVYLFVTCSLPVQEKLISKCKPFPYIMTCLFPCLVLHFVTLPFANWFIKELFTYNFFFILGYLYYKRVGYTNITILAIVFAVLTLYGFIHGEMPPMQDNKFPPNLYFLLFSFAALCMLSLTIGRIRIRYNKILRLWNERGYNIYLYQCLSHYTVYLLTHEWISQLGSGMVFIILFVATFTVATIISLVSYPFEKLVTKMLLNIRK